MTYMNIQTVMSGLVGRTLDAEELCMLHHLSSQGLAKINRDIAKGIPYEQTLRELRVAFFALRQRRELMNQSLSRSVLRAISEVKKQKKQPQCDPVAANPCSSPVLPIADRPQPPALPSSLQSMTSAPEVLESVASFHSTTVAATAAAAAAAPLVETSKLEQSGGGAAGSQMTSEAMLSTDEMLFVAVHFRGGQFLPPFQPDGTLMEGFELDSLAMEFLLAQLESDFAMLCSIGGRRFQLSHLTPTTCPKGLLAPSTTSDMGHRPHRRSNARGLSNGNNSQATNLSSTYMRPEGRRTLVGLSPIVVWFNETAEEPLQVSAIDAAFLFASLTPSKHRGRRGSSKVCPDFPIIANATTAAPEIEQDQKPSNEGAVATTTTTITAAPRSPPCLKSLLRSADSKKKDRAKVTYAVDFGGPIVDVTSPVVLISPVPSITSTGTSSSSSSSYGPRNSISGSDDDSYRPSTDAPSSTLSPVVCCPMDTFGKVEVAVSPKAKGKFAAAMYRLRCFFRLRFSSKLAKPSH